MTTPPPDPFSSVVTARDVYDATRDTQAEVRALGQRLDMSEQRATERDTEARARHADHEARIRSLEMWRYALPISAVGSVAAAVAAIVAALQGAT